MSYLFSSESVTVGHPDKLADQISDAVLDALLKKDPEARVACETMLTTGLIFIAGEITTTAYVDIQKIARKVLHECGYVCPEYGIDADDCAVLTSIDEQSPDIAKGVNPGGAGDQGLMFGYACNETKELMPLPITLAHKLTRKLREVREDGTLPYLRPDGKAEITFEYDDKHKPQKITSVVLSAQHDPEIKLSKLKKDIKEEVIKPVCGKYLSNKTNFYINPTGRFVTGGPHGDTGLTGRKIIVDTYGGMARHGGGCFSGKDATKVDRSAAYMARYIAKNIVGAGLADKCEVQLAYVIGVENPVSIFVDTFDTGKIDNEKLVKMIGEVFPLKPREIIEHLDLKKPIYKKTAENGHFGRSIFGWEKLDQVDKLKTYL